MTRTVLVTGGAGFIGSHLVEQLLELGDRVVVIDNFDDFYKRNIKEQNIAEVIDHPNFRLVDMDIRDQVELENSLSEEFDVIIHIAGKAGVRPSIQDPMAYQSVNVNGTQNLLEFARKRNIKQFVFASSSSVYGVNPNVPWKESDLELQPISPYASTKISCELLGHVYHHLYDIRFVALRFFTVYGPRQRPDLAIHKFVKLIDNDQPIPVFGDGSTRRDYTFVDDIVRGILSAAKYDETGFEIINLGNHRTVSLSELISTIEEELGKKAIIDRQPEQPGDVPQTFASINKASNLLDYQPKTTFKDGIRKFVEWYQLKKS